MLTAYPGRFLLAAKTAVKAPVIKKVAVAAKVEPKKKVKKVSDPTKFRHSTFKGNNLNQLIQALPEPASKDTSTWLHRHGYGLKFYRSYWARYAEPSYWTVVKYRPKPRVGGQARIWGIKTWRGVTEPFPRLIDSKQKSDWRILLEPGTQLGPSVDDFWQAPEITESSDPAASTQLPEGLKGTKPNSWPYEWGTQGKRPNKGKPMPPADAAEQPAAETKES